MSKDGDFERLLEMAQTLGGDAVLDYLDSLDAPVVRKPHTSPFRSFVPATYRRDISPIPCAACGKTITSFWGGAVELSAARVVEMTTARHGRPLCADCSGHEAQQRVARGGR